MSETQFVMPTASQRRAASLRRLVSFADDLHPRDGYLCQDDSELLADLIKGADAPRGGAATIPAELRRAHDRLKRVVEGNVGFPECVEASHAFTRTAYEAVGAMLAADEAALSAGAELAAAVADVLSYRVEGSTRGDLRDSDGSRKALARLASALAATRSEVTNIGSQ